MVTAPLIFSTFPPSSMVAGDYMDEIANVASWSEEGGCTGALIYTDNSLLDPWVVAQSVIQHTKRLTPLVAVQPIYMHPYAAAKMVASLAELHQRRVYLNMVAGGFLNDLRALDDETDHDRRYERLIEYTTIIQRLISDDGPTSFDGDWYRVKNLRLRPTVAPDLRPGYMVSGSSPAGMATARVLGATAVRYPRPASDYARQPDPGNTDTGIRIGIIAREEPQQAWRIAWERFPGDERGRVTHKLAMATSDSDWHQQLSVLGDEARRGASPYWLHPFENYKTFCPYLVGSYDEVADAVAEYLDVGFSTFILDVPREPEDLVHSRLVIERARGRMKVA